ncbi:hypothetical protein [Prescottella equi]
MKALALFSFAVTLAVLGAAVFYTVRVENALYTDTVDEEKS